MAVNNPHGHNQYTDKKKTENAGANGKQAASGSTAGARSGSGEQHADAGRQSHKSDDKSSSQGGR